MPTLKRSEWLKKLHSARNKHEMAVVYDAWGRDYELETMIEGYTMPAIMTGLIGRYVFSREAPILDVGAGTGILGEMLSVLGYRNLTAIDFSQGMLDLCRQRGIYCDLRRMLLGEKLNFRDNTFTATVVMGVFGKGHAPPDAFDELTRITKRDGFILFSIRADEYETQGFKEKQDSLERNGQWQPVEMTEPFDSLPLAESEIMNLIFVYKVL